MHGVQVRLPNTDIRVALTFPAQDLVLTNTRFPPEQTSHKCMAYLVMDLDILQLVLL